MNKQYLITIDDSGNDLGAMEKLEAHQKGVAHRAISVMVRNSKGQVLLQRRSENKYHCGGLWSNTCCGHPTPGESPAKAAMRRLAEEMNISCPLVPAGVFRYSCRVTDGLSENELVHLFVGQNDSECAPNPAEVSLVKWVQPNDLESEIDADADRFTPWLRLYVRNRPDFIRAQPPFDA